MSSVKKRWLCIIALVLAVCVSLGTVLMIRANQPVEPKTVYLLPKPNPERAEILARALQPKRHAYATRASDSAQAQDTREERSESSSSESLSHDAELDDAELEAFLLGLEDDTAEEKRDFPPVPEEFPFTPVWLRSAGYRKGDKPGNEQIARVLIKLWNQGDHDFQGGTIRHNDGQIYPIYPDVLYVQWKERVIDNGDGNPFPVRYIAGSIGPFAPEFDATDIVTGGFQAKYPDIRFVPFEHAGYDPYTFLAEND